LDTLSIESVGSVHQLLSRQRVDHAIVAKTQEVARANGEAVVTHLAAAAAMSERPAPEDGRRHAVDVVV